MGALRVLQGEHAIFFPNIGDGREPSVVYALTMSTLLFGRTLLATRLPTALGSAAMVFATFWIGRLFFGRDEESGRATPWRGLLIGGIGAGLMAVSISHTILGRTAYSKATFMPPSALLESWPALVGLERAKLVADRIGRRVHRAVAVHIYVSAYRTLSNCLIWVELSLAPALSLLGKVRAELPWAAAFVGVAGLVSAPLLVYFALHPEYFFLRSQKLWVFDPVHSQGSPLGAFVLNVWDHLLALGFRGDPHPRGNYAGQPYTEPLASLLLFAGRGDDSIALAAVHLPPSASLVDDHDGAVTSGQELRVPHKHSHDRHCAGDLSVGRCRRVGGVPIFARAFFSQKRDLGRPLLSGS